jgi:hypothetical protein
VVIDEWRRSGDGWESFSWCMSSERERKESIREKEEELE